ncbi:GNAT family N-acetyltransferase [Shewanella sedimentimangrovi]|uniref:GNAT family N-acetyltransferase n=1 Tax=Shewanella sedimentimangrovi TaxID=2814293 RepID=A0ABX7R472_9GAMM|nr:GNAT family N-acetyltransferase [Shewanella sedimentimangrovi]QSX38627.1 GNAT family N-acetyltransferase [Shewanella sedimentimangrovi]
MELEFVFVSSVREIAKADWDGLFGVDHPFSGWDFLAALEDSGAVGAGSGWQPLHLKVMAQGQLLALMPGYLKLHSFGEYVFDWRWAEAYGRQGLDYYPKWINAIPFTPVTGPRLAFTPGLSTEQQTGLEEAIQAFLDSCLEQGLFHSWHRLFIDQGSALAWQSRGAIGRVDGQFHWFNRDYGSFEDFLAQLRSQKRKSIRKERARFAELEFDWQGGSGLQEADWTEFYLCYRRTYAKRSGHGGYLNQAFFVLLGNALGDAVQLLRVRDKEGNLVASALFLQDSSSLYGRYWGALRPIDGLHFEVCYYRGIDYAITHGLKRFHAGAQGEHKVPRGFEPVQTFSCHRLAHDGFQVAIARACAAEKPFIEDWLAELKEKLPFSRRDW